MKLLHFHSQHPLSCKEGIIYSQALRCNMIIFKDHILQEELNHLTRVFLARAYPLDLIIKIIKNALIYTRSNSQSLLRQRQIIHNLHLNNWKTIANNDTFPPSGHISRYLYMQNPAAFATILSTPYKYMAHHHTISNSSTKMQLNTPTHANAPIVATLFFPSP